MKCWHQLLRPSRILRWYTWWTLQRCLISTPCTNCMIPARLCFSIGTNTLWLTLEQVTTIRLIGLSETNKSSLISLRLSSVVQGKDAVLSSLPKITLPNTATNFVHTNEPHTQTTRYVTNTDMSNTGHAFNVKCWCYISRLRILLLYHISCDSKNVPNSFSSYHVTTFVV